MDERTGSVMAPPMPDTAEMVDKLAAHRTLGTAPRAELEWLAAHGDRHHYAAGALLARRGDVPESMIIMLSGHGSFYVNRGTGRKNVMEWGEGDVIGVLPFSRMTGAIGDALVDQPSDTLVIHRDHFPEMLRECPEVTAILVHALLDRVRHTTSTDWQDDKIMSLGRLSAGLSHELNNPASAASRSAKLLGDALMRSDDATSALIGARLTDAQLACLDVVRRRISATVAEPLSAIDRADREDEFSRWLEARRADPQIASALAETSVTIAMLDDVANGLPAGALEPALNWLAAGYASRALATDVERASARIYELVSAVKRFTYMDRPTVAEPASITQALADTVTVLAAKAHSKSATVELEIAPDLPLVRAFGAELNQVWSNLIENALDAIGESGRVVVSARAEGGNVVVRVVDDGQGIADDIKGRIFDPFFTTKPVGSTGLGLDIARRIVRRHEGQIELDSRRGHTEFRVVLPAESSVA